MQNILDKYKIKIDLNTILSIWNEGNRHYHNLNHLNKLLEDINNSNLSEIETEILIIVALFHDIVYDVKNPDNEKLSSEFFLDCCVDKSNPYIKIINQIILDTKTHSLSDEFIKTLKHATISMVGVSNKSAYFFKNALENYSKLSKIFCDLDMSICESSYDELLDWEEGIYDEYKIFGDKLYKEGRLKFLESLLDKYVDNTDNLLKLIDYVKSNYISENYKTINETYFKDLDICTYIRGDYKAIGWLDKEHDFTKGEVPTEFLDKLKKIKTSYHCKGSHRCEFCEIQTRDSQSSSSIIVKGNDVEYVSPEMIIHYITRHNYLPPKEYIDAVLNFN